MYSCISRLLTSLSVADNPVQGDHDYREADDCLCDPQCHPDFDPSKQGLLIHVIGVRLIPSLVFFHLVRVPRAGLHKDFNDMEECHFQRGTACMQSCMYLNLVASAH
jgi:hypothetical protein